MHGPYDYDAAGEQYHRGKHDLPVDSVAYRFISEARAEKIGRWVKSTDTVLEFGVGAGWNLAKLNCASACGFDPSAHLRSMVESQGAQFIANEADIPVGTFDVVLCHHVLEHLTDSYASLQKMRRWLRQAGRLLIYVPYEYQRKFSRYRRDDSDHHLYSWNVQTASALIETAGFEVEASYLGYFGFDRFAALATSKFGRFGYRFLRTAMHLALRPLEVVVVARAH